MDTLYESYTYSAITPDHWYRRRIIRNDQRYHKCVKICSQNYPFLGSTECVFKVVQGKKWWSEIENSVDIITLIMVFV